MREVKEDVCSYGVVVGEDDPRRGMSRGKDPEAEHTPGAQPGAPWGEGREIVCIGAEQIQWALYVGDCKALTFA